MPKKTKNKCARVGPINQVQPWFRARVKRQRRRNAIAKLSRKINRGQI